MGKTKLEWKLEDINSSVGSLKTPGYSTVHSPLFHVSNTLKCLRWLGFPITPTNIKWDDFVFMYFREHLRLFMMMVLFFTPNAALLGSLRYNIDDFKRFYNISSMDFIVEIIALFVIPFGFNIVYFTNFKNKVKSINKICKMMSGVNYRQECYHNCQNIYVKAKERVFNSLIMYTMMGIVIATLFLMSNYVAFVFDKIGYPLNESSKVIISGIMPITVLLGPLSPMVSSGDFVVNYLIGHLSENLKRLRTSLKRFISVEEEIPFFIKSTDGKTSLDENKSIEADAKSLYPNANLLSIIKVTLDICKTIKKVNKTFAPILFYAYAGNLLIATTAFYTFAKSIFITNFSPMSLSWGILNLVSFTLYMARLYESTTSGHNLGQNMRLLKHSFKQFRVSRRQIWISNKKCSNYEAYEEKLEVIDDLLDNSSPISPYGYFGMTGGSFLSALATISTYLIVLIQFKTSEK